MSKVCEIKVDAGVTWFKYLCPACNRIEEVPIEGHPSTNWKFSGSEEFPSLTPSVVIATFRKTTEDNMRCHSHIHEGKISFDFDCTHELAGKTVPMIPLEETDSAPKN